MMSTVCVLGGVSYDTIVYMEQFPEPKSQTVRSKGAHETIGSTGAGKAFCLNRLRMKVSFHGMIGEDRYGEIIKAACKHEKIQFIYGVDPKGTGFPSIAIVQLLNLRWRIARWSLILERVIISY